MPQLAPVTLYLRIEPNQANNENRWEQVNELNKFGYMIYNALLESPNLDLAQPGGGVAQNLGGFGLQQYGMAVKPRFGATPAQATITGFYNVDSVFHGTDDLGDRDLATQPYPDTQVISGGQWRTGPAGAKPWQANPQPWVAGVVKALKAEVEEYLAVNLPTSMVVSVFRIDYQGSIWGDGGYHFPV
jgi:hypothetical protein